MIFKDSFTVLDKIQLLQRSILVNSFAYYELDQNLLSDFQYDDNAKQLAELRRQYPEEFKKSHYYKYFHDYCSEEDNAHYTSGFDLLMRVYKADKELHRYLHLDALLAVETKQKYKMGGI